LPPARQLSSVYSSAPTLQVYSPYHYTMRFSTFIFPLTILAGFVLASPLEERGTKITEVASASEPKYEAVNGKSTPPSAGAHVEGGGTGVTVEKPGKSKRSDYNELDGRSTPYGTLYVYTGYGCSGDYYGYDLPVDAYTCYWVHWFNSFKVVASSGLTYGVYVGHDCGGVLPY
jgi:hypothetical protein